MPPSEAEIAVIAHKVDSMHSDLGDMRTILRDLTTAVNKLSIIEERQQQASLTQERFFKVLDDINTKINGMNSRIVELEIAEPMQKQTSSWILTSIGGILGIIGTFFIHKFLGQ